MEILLIPSLALFGLYTINQQKPSKKEEFGNDLPNTNIPDANYPNDYPINNVNSDTTITSKLSTINQYDGTGAYTDKYFIGETEFNNPLLSNKTTKFQSLTGPQSSEYFAHNNMQPFFGSKSHDTHTKNNVNEGLLDNMIGQGSQTITKREIAPLFDAKSNLSWANGMPNTSEFVRSRMVASKSMNNVNPFPQQRVAPGIGLGAGTEGSGGFNSGMLGRELWMDKTVDELRNATNPKASGLSQLGFEGPAGAYVKNMGTIGTVEKNRPETTFELGMERSIGASSATKATAIHGETIDRFVNRPDTNISYSGIAGPTNTASQLMDGEYMPSNRIELGAEQLGPVSGSNRFHLANQGDFGLKSVIAYPNNRSTNYNDDYFGIIGQTVGSILSPILDVLKPNRKNNTVGTLRPLQNAVANVKNSYIFNPNDRTPTTNREMEKLYAQNLYTVNASQYQNNNGYMVTNPQLNQTHRNEIINQGQNDYIGGGSSSNKYGDTYSSTYETTNGIKEIGISRSGFTPAGNMSTFNGDVNNMSSNPSRQNMMMDMAQFQNAPKSMNQMGPDMSLMGRSMGGNYLYDGISMDRNTNDTMGDILKGNPYALKPMSQI